MIVAFTGTREGLATPQFRTISNIVSCYWIKELVVLHGCCVGADAEFHHIARKLGAYIIGHPAFPEGHPMRGVRDADCDEIEPIRPALDRNKLMVELSVQLIAAPLGFDEIGRSGTWQTIRYSRVLEKARVIVYPDGRGDLERKVELVPFAVQMETQKAR